MYARLATQNQFCKLSAGELVRAEAPFHFLTLAANGVASTATVGQKRRCCTHELPFARTLGLRDAAQVDAFLELYGQWSVDGGGADASMSTPYAPRTPRTTASADWTMLVGACQRALQRYDEWLWTQLDGELARRVVSGARGSPTTTLLLRALRRATR
jgi:hypothetical protein